MTTKGKWDVALGEEPLVLCEKEDGAYWIIATTSGDVCDMSAEKPTDEALANAELIALAGNLNQKYDLEKLEELVECVRIAIEQLNEYSPFGDDDLTDALKSFTR